ncbi:MAG: F-box-like domain-containing protein [Sulfobacillus sp.]
MESIVDLPDELLAMIFQLLPPWQWAQVARTCRQFNRVCEEDHWYWEPRARAKWRNVDGELYAYNWQELYRDNYLRGRQGTFSWKIENFSQISQVTLYSPVFNVGGYPWKILLFPRGNHDPTCLAMYLKPGDEVEKYPFRKVLSVFMLVGSEGKNLARTCEHIFDRREPDWGFTSYIRFSQLRDSSSGFIKDDCLHIEIQLTVSAVADPDEGFGGDIGYLDPDEKELIQKYVDMGYLRDHVEEKYGMFRESSKRSQDEPMTKEHIDMFQQMLKAIPMYPGIPSLQQGMFRRKPGAPAPAAVPAAVPATVPAAAAAPAPAAAAVPAAAAAPVPVPAAAAVPAAAPVPVLASYGIAGIVRPRIDYSIDGAKRKPRRHNRRRPRRNPRDKNNTANPS